MPHSAATLDPNAPTSQTGITKFQSSSTGSEILVHFLAGIDTFAAVTGFTVRYRIQSEPVRTASCPRPGREFLRQESFTLFDGFHINV